jgi:hypothetical protein
LVPRVVAEPPRSRACADAARIWPRRAACQPAPTAAPHRAAPPRTADTPRHATTTAPPQHVFDNFSFTNVDGLSEANREKMEQLRERLAAEAEAAASSSGGAGGSAGGGEGSAAALLAAADARGLLPPMGPPARLSINQLLQWHDATSGAGARGGAQE